MSRAPGRAFGRGHENRFECNDDDSVFTDGLAVEDPWGFSHTADVIYQPPGLSFSADRRIELIPTGAEDGMEIAITWERGLDAPTKR